MNKYTLLNEPDKTIFVFEKLGKVYGHIIKNKTIKSQQSSYSKRADMIQSSYSRLTIRRLSMFKTGFPLSNYDMIQSCHTKQNGSHCHPAW
jgi:hypothetical protein